MAEAPPPARPRSGTMMTLLSVGLVFLILFNADLRNALGRYAGYVLEPTIGFGGRYPVLTILLAGALLVVVTTLVRHFTTDWIQMARNQAHMRHFTGEFSKARKENNTYKIKKLTEAQPKMMQASQEMQAKQMRTMPITTLIAVPIYAWLITFLTELDYTWFSAPWNPHVDMFTTNGIIPGLGSLFPHWVLLNIALSIPVGALIQKAMKYLAWKERWQKRHPGAA
jgi:uncharacterized membrane protein (DUF106 family)